MAATNLNKYLSDFFFFFTIENSTSPIHKLKKKKKSDVNPQFGYLVFFHF